MLLTDKALANQAITIQEAQELETFIDSDDWTDENDMPPNIRATYDIALKHYHHGRCH